MLHCIFFLYYFIHSSLNSQQLWRKLSALDARGETHALIAEKKLEQINLRTEIEKFTLLEEISWRQKSRVLQLRERDSNKRFFHKMTNSNRRNNGIESLLVNGSLSSNQGMIENCITQIFMNLYSEQQVIRPFPNVLEFPMISRDNAVWLERPFKEAEVFEVIQNFNGDKSAGPDGFPMAFFQACWEILKFDLMAIFHHFYARGQFEKSLNATFITLIPKKSAAIEHGHDRYNLIFTECFCEE